MFEKLLSLLPYNPALAHQLVFYSRRMRQEAAIRRIGVVFIVLAFMVQFFAFASPPQPTSAASTNDLINGGISSAADAKRNCDKNVQNYRDIMAYYGITCADIGSAGTVTFRSTDLGNRLYSMGRLPYGARNANTHKITGETPVDIPGAGRIYMRHLSSFDSGAYSTYRALKLRSSGTGRIFYILYNCGNLVGIGIPTPFKACKYDSSLPADSSKCVAPCKYDKNLPADSSKCFKPCKYDKSLPSDSSKCFKPCKYDKNLPADSSKCVAPCKYNKNLPSNSPQCFAHCPLPGKTNLPQNSPQCVAPCPYNAALPANSPQCFQACQYNKTLPVDSPDCFQVCQYDNSLPVDSPACFQPCQYDNTIPANSPQCVAVCQYDKTLPANSPQCISPCQYNNTIASNSPDCKPCEQSQSSQDTAACVAVNKTAGNVTTGTANADGTTAQPNDVINYTLYAQNNGKAVVKQFTFQESLSDVLDYADVTDLHGGTLSDDKTATWPAVDIAAGQTATVQVTVKVKDPIPQTPTDPGDPGHFDLVMTNVYGSTINIKVPGSPTKAIETVATTLPNTGPGTSLFISVLAVIGAGYFYGRARLLAKESMIAVHEAAGA